jgi:hypothetical protein
VRKGARSHSETDRQMDRDRERRTR